MIEPIVIKVVDKVPIVVSGPQYVVCDNSDYTVVWQLDEEWAQFESRTMQVNYKDGTYERVLFTGNTCALPAIPVKDWFYVGLFAGDIHTTRPVKLFANRAITTDSGEERDPMPDGYAQAIKALDGKLDKNQGAENAGKALVVGDDGTVVPGEAQGGSLPAMSSDTAGKLLTNDGEKAEWGDAVRYDVAQNMNGNEQLQARKNIDAFPGKTLQYFYDTTAGSKHDNDIVAADVYDVIAPGNTYSDGTHSNAGMEFPAYVMSSRNLAQSYYEMRLLDNNGAVWNVVINKSSKALHDCSKISGKQVMCVNFTQGTDGNWSADKNWDDAAALIEAGGYVYAMTDGQVIPLVIYHAESPIVFHIALHNTSAVSFKVVVWFPDGTITVSDGLLPVVMYGEQELTADQQAQARKNIGLTPVAKTDEMTQSVGLDAETGELYTKPGAKAYTLPIASPTQLGGVKPVAKTADMTQMRVGVDANGVLWMAPDAWYMDITGSLDAPVISQTPESVYTAYVRGHAVYARVRFSEFENLPIVLPLYSLYGGEERVHMLCFSGNANPHGFGITTPTTLTITYDALATTKWNAFLDAQPSALPNPNALTITIGDNVVSYDGSAARSVTIPTGGSSGGETWELINTFEVAEADAARVIKIDKDSNGNAFSLKEFAFRAVTNSTKTDGSVYGWFCVNGRGTYNSGLGGFQTNYVRHPSTGAATANDVIGRALPFGLVYDHSTNRKASEGIQNSTVTEVHEVELAGYQFTENLLYGTFSLWGVRK